MMLFRLSQLVKFELDQALTQLIVTESAWCLQLKVQHSFQEFSRQD